MKHGHHSRRKKAAPRAARAAEPEDSSEEDFMTGARGVHIVFVPELFSHPRSHLWLEPARPILPLLRKLAGRLTQDDVRCFVGSLPWTRLEGLSNEEALEHFFEAPWSMWGAFWDDLIASPDIFKYLDYWLDYFGIGFLLFPVGRESTPMLDRWMSCEVPSRILSRIIFVSFDGGASGLRLESGFEFVNFPSEYQKLLLLLEGPVGASLPPTDTGDVSWGALAALWLRRIMRRATESQDLRSEEDYAGALRVRSEVFLGAATPRVVAPGGEFVARFAAYVQDFRQQVGSIFAKEAPKSEALLDLASCRWRVGTKVSVRLSARDLTIKTGTQSFTWNGEYETLRFDVEVPPDCRETQAVLKFDVAIDGVIISTLRPEIEINKDGAAGRAAGVETTEVRSPRSAFASYATGDRRSVLGRVRSLQIHTGIDVFLDCLSVRPGEEWKPEIVRQIREREIFWLFWSRRASKSNWVEWEWRQALAAKTLRGIQPHPLEPSDVAPPPPELADLQFGTAYESYLVSLRESWFKYKLHRLRESVGRLLRN